MSLKSDEEMTSARASELLRGGAEPAEVYPAWEKWLYETYGEGLTRGRLEQGVRPGVGQGAQRRP